MRFIVGAAAKSSGQQRLNSVHQTHLVPARGKLVLQKIIEYNGQWIPGSVDANKRLMLFWKHFCFIHFFEWKKYLVDKKKCWMSVLDFLLQNPI